MGRSVSRLLLFNVGFITLLQKLRAVIDHYLHNFSRTFTKK